MFNVSKIVLSSSLRTCNARILYLQFNKEKRSFHQNLSLRESSKQSVPSNITESGNFKGSENHTWIGPPHELSNLRLKVFPQTRNLTDAEKHFYLKSQETQDWNQKYWEDHNRDFIQTRKEFLEKIVKEKNLPKKEALTSEEMSEFYKHFLNSNHKKHMQYNWDWYKKNITLIILAAKANFSKFVKVLKN